MLRTRAAWIVCLLGWAGQIEANLQGRRNRLPHRIGAAALLFFYPAPASAMTCASCHKTEALSQPSTSMGHALELVEDCSILREHPRLTFQYGRYSYTIARQGQALGVVASVRERAAA